MGAEPHERAAPVVVDGRNVVQPLAVGGVTKPEAALVADFGEECIELGGLRPLLIRPGK
jgi:hypothetical protein